LELSFGKAIIRLVFAEPGAAMPAMVCNATKCSAIALVLVAATAERAVRSSEWEF